METYDDDVRRYVAIFKLHGSVDVPVNLLGSVAEKILVRDKTVQLMKHGKNMRVYKKRRRDARN